MEMLVVLAIMTLIMAIIPPMFTIVITNTQVKSAARELAAGLKYARSRAIDQQKETILTLNVEQKFFQVNKKQKSLNVSDDTTISLTTARSEQISPHEGHIRFFPDGSSTGGQIKLSNASKEFLIDVNWLTGKVRIYP